jgi:PAS domain S-box-containing protein
MWVYDLETLKFLEVNDTAIFHYGYSRAEFLAMSIKEIRPADQLPLLEKDLQQLKAKVKQTNNWIHKLKNGALVDVEVTSHRLDLKGRKAVLVVAKDITEQKRTDEQIRKLNEELQLNLAQLEATNKELESFSYSVSHDLRAPLRALSGYSQMIAEDYGESLDEEARRLLGNIHQNAKKMGVLIDDLLGFSRLGRKEVEKEMVNMHAMMETILNDLQPLPINTVIKVNALPPAFADYSLLRQVWINLVSNAIKYSSKKPEPVVEIGSQAAEAETVYLVRDNGAGFNMQYAEKLFGVFQRLHNPNEFQGTGIGLAIVQRIIAKHGGRVWAEGKVDQGATFYFTLPKS